MPDPHHLPPDAFAARALACRRGERLVFARLDFDLAAGGVLVLMGPNGSGKSSLLRLLAGLSPPDSGVIGWDGAAIADDMAAHRARLHFIGHAEALKAPMSVRETVQFWAGMRGAAAPEAALDVFRLRALSDLPCRILSAGQRRRVALTRLAASPAPLWLLDEPATGLDSDSAADLWRLIGQHRAAGGRIVLSAHAAPPLEGAEVLALDDYAARSVA
jgi:heme exporter protein A